MLRKILFPVLFLAVMAILFLLFNPTKSHDVTAVRPAREKAVQAVYATGTVEASRMIAIAPRVGARLISLEVDEGQAVEAGQILARLEDADIRENLNELEARAALAQKELRRAQSLAKTGAISKTALDEAVTNEKAAAAAAESTRAQLSYLQLTAPEAGTIIRRDGEIGEMITAGTAVYWMNGGDELRIETEVDEEDIPLVKPGLPVLVRADAYPGETFKGTVQSITLKGDPVARSYRVRVGLDADTPLMIGMTAETNIIAQEKEGALMVPATAVKDGQVIKIANGKAEIAAVRTGIKTTDKVEIVEGLSEEEVVVEKYDATLVDKNNVRAKVNR
jgi:multidrug efflux system membrane fusion protein